MGECVDNGWIWDMKITDYRPLQVDEEAELESLLVILQDVRVNRLVEDLFVWWRSKHGFSVKNNYLVVQAVLHSDVQINPNIVQLFDLLWITNAPRKILIFGWMLLLNRLPTGIALTKRGIINGSENLLCSLCSAAEEMMAHLFLDYSIVLQVWEYIYKWLDFPFQFDVDASGTNCSSFALLLKERA
ncbi:unnamed protein product [Lathyrus oleraceus]